MTGKWNPRYVAYAADHGRAPDAMLAFDEERYPGGRMCGFMVWISERWREWGLVTGHPRGKDAEAVLGSADHVAFDAWLGSR